MNLCRTCEFWSAPEDGEKAGIQNLGRCARTPMVWDATDWDEEGYSRVLKNQYKDRLAFVKDASDYFATLLTLPDFGCVMHSPKL